MISDEEFTHQMGRLIDVFGEKPFSKGRMKRIKEIMAPRSQSVMKDLVTRFVDEKRFAPLPNDFWEAVRARPVNISQSLGPGCASCEEGLIFAVPKKGGSRAAFRCDCSAGHQLSSDIPLWGKHREKDWKLGWDPAPNLTLADSEGP